MAALDRHLRSSVASGPIASSELARRSELGKPPIQIDPFVTADPNRPYKVVVLDGALTLQAWFHSTEMPRAQ